jgi:deoxyribodipyrimidine photolyase-related protein
MTTKPYISGSAYIDRMGDYCGDCSFDPRSTCPVTRLYWAFLARHAEALGRLPRMRLPLASARRRSETERERDGRVYRLTAKRLAAGRTMRPEDVESTENSA